MNKLAVGWQSANKRLFASLIAIVGVGLVTYWNALAIGFWTDDYDFLETAGRLNWQDYLVTYFDPRLQWHWYRPLQGIEWEIGYALFGIAPTGYHLIQILLHIANVLLLFGLTHRVTRRLRLALLAALFYMTLPAYSLAVAWPAVADPLVAVFFLLTIWLWLDYIERGGTRRFALAYVVFIATLLSKEIGVVLPIVLFLADRWLVREPASLNQLIKRYLLFLLTLPVYGLFEINILTRGVFTQSLGYGVGGHILTNLVQHLTTLAFPWGIEPPLSYVWLLIVFGLFGYAAYRRVWSLVFLGAAMILTLLPILPFPSNIASADRYLYLPLMGSMVGLAIILDGAFSYIRNTHWRRAATVGLSLSVIGFIGWQSTIVSDATVSFADTVRAERLRFRPVLQMHSSLPPGSLLYFIAPNSEYVSGMVFTRYGADVTGESTETGHVVRLRDYVSGFVYYRDEQNNWHEQIVDKNQRAQFSPTLPTKFGEALILKQAEFTADRIKRGEALVVILYWQAVAPIAEDYSVFIHLVSKDGQIIAGADQLLLKGDTPTSHWRANEPVSQGIVVPIDSTISPGDYQLQVGVYFLPTLERLPLTDDMDAVITDQIVIQPITIE